MSLMVALQPRLGTALVVGAGSVAARKVASLLQAGFAVRVIAPQFGAGVEGSPAELVQRSYREGDVDGAALVFACTDSREVNRAVGEAARAAGIPVNVADAPEESTFFSVAVHGDGDILVGVSTGGAGPRLAADIRDEIALKLSGEWPAKAAAARGRRVAARRSRP